MNRYEKITSKENKTDKKAFLLRYFAIHTFIVYKIPKYFLVFLKFSKLKSIGKYGLNTV